MTLEGISASIPEIRLDILGANRICARPRIPWRFSLKVIWASFKAAFLRSPGGPPDRLVRRSLYYLLKRTFNLQKVM